jgi:Tfp pilus assembly protein PilN
VRPVNLIPPEDRRGDRAPLRAGKLSYVLIGALALVLAGVSAVVLLGNQVKDREAELAGLEETQAAVTAQAEALRPYAEFAALTASRVLTVTSLAQSRFDWERVMRELALVLPEDVWLTALTGSAGEGSYSEGAAESGIAGPSLTMKGCGKGHESVARLLQALRDIDGVTRVGLTRSVLPEEQVVNSGGSGGDCQTRNFIAGFDITVAFDGVTAPAVPAAPAPGTTPTPAATATPAETQEARSSVAEQTENAENAANLVPGVAR